MDLIEPMEQMHRRKKNNWSCPSRFSFIVIYTGHYSRDTDGNQLNKSNRFCANVEERGLRLNRQTWLQLNLKSATCGRNIIKFNLLPSFDYHRSRASQQQAKIEAR